jgi:hypothetical protein
MSIFGSIMSKIFGTKPADAAEAASGAAPSAAEAVAQAGSAAAGAVASAASAAAAISDVDVAKMLDGLADKAGETLNWRVSIVDLMKLLGLDSSLAHRKELAKELHYTGDTGDSAKMNVWLHEQVIAKLAANGGKTPQDLLS